jgi:ABC-2 type transport system ATP-binding protein
VIIDGGRVIAEGTPGELKTMAGSDRIELHTRDVDMLALAAGALDHLGGGEPTVDRATLQCSIAAVDGPDLLPAVVRALDDAGAEVEDITLRRPTLDEVFLTLTGQPASPTGPDPAGDTQHPSTTLEELK